MEEEKEEAGMTPAAVAAKEEGAGMMTPPAEVSKQEEVRLMTPVALVEEMGCPVVGSAALVLCSFGRWQWQARWRA
jgi:hypothetical protein